MKKTRLIEISVALGLVISVILSITGFGAECKKIRQDVVRLHILANSDSEQDQAVKLAVRDALLSSGKELFSGTVNVKNAADCLEVQKQYLIDVANKILEENGFEYKTNIYLTKEYFLTRQYENFTLPAGEYLALKVILGEGNGHNWWCVMFPPLCLPAATENTELDAVFGKNGAEIIGCSDKYIMKFKIIELFEDLKHRIKKVM